MASDNASNNEVMLRIVAECLQNMNVSFDASQNHSRCLAHIINLAAKAAIETIRPGSKPIGSRSNSFDNSHNESYNSNSEDDACELDADDSEQEEDINNAEEELIVSAANPN